MLPVYSEYDVYGDAHLRHFRRANKAWRHCAYAVLAVGGRHCSCCEYWQQCMPIVRYRPSLLRVLYTHSLYLRLCAFVLTAWTPSVSGFDAAGTAGTRSKLSWEDTACIGNVLGYVMRIYYCHFWQFFIIVFPLIVYSHITSTRNTEVVLSILLLYSEIRCDVYWSDHLCS